MKRSHRIILLTVLALIIIIGTTAVLLIETPKASAPSPKLNKTPVSLSLYYIALDDGGKSGAEIGCGDSAVAITVSDVVTDDKIKSTFERILSNQDRFYGQSGLYNALYDSDIIYDSSSVSNDKVTVNLTGSFMLSGTCDNPRVKAQLELSAKAAAGVSQAEIFVNGKTLDEVISLQ